MAGVILESRSSNRSEEDEEVSAGLHKLKHLAHRMKSEPRNFSEKDVFFVQDLVVYLQSLHEECVKLRENFETETINASAIRYHLYFLPSQIQREIKASVRLARESNTSRIQELEVYKNAFLQDPSKFASNFEETSKDILKQIEVNMNEMKGRLDSVDKENVHLHPQRDKLHERHEDVVTHLNQTLQEKASKQILLNDTRDQLREAHQTIADLEDDLKELDKMLAQERADTKKQKRELKKEIDETKKNIKEQEKENSVKKEELDALRKELEEKRERLLIKTRSTTMIEKNCEELKAKEESLEERLEFLRRDNERLRVELIEVSRKDFEQQMAHTESKEKLELQIKEIQQKSESVIEDNTKLKKRNAKLHADLRLANEEKKADNDSIKKLKEQATDQQKAISDLTDESSRLMAENEQYESEIQAIQETHDSAMKVKNSEADALKEKLADVQSLSSHKTSLVASVAGDSSNKTSLDLSSAPSLDGPSQKEGTSYSDQALLPDASIDANDILDVLPCIPEGVSEALASDIQFWKQMKSLSISSEELFSFSSQIEKELQNELDEILKQMEKLKAENARQLSTLNKRISEGKKEHSTLTKEGQELQKSLKKAETEIKQNQEKLKKAKEDYQKMREKLEKDVKMYEASVEKYTKAKTSKEEKLAHDTPIYVKLQEDHKTYGERYTQRKRQITGMKAQNNNLINEVAATKKTLEDLETPKKQAEKNLAERRRETVEELERQGRHKKRLETSIAEMGEKIVCVVDQNNRFIEHFDAFESELNQITEEIIDSGSQTKEFRNACIDTREDILQKWVTSLHETRAFNARDSTVLRKIEEEEISTLEKQKKLEFVADDLQLQIIQMAKYLSAITQFRGATEPEKEPDPLDQICEELVSQINHTTTVVHEELTEPEISQLVPEVSAAVEEKKTVLDEDVDEKPTSIDKETDVAIEAMAEKVQQVESSVSNPDEMIHDQEIALTDSIVDDESESPAIVQGEPEEADDVCRNIFEEMLQDILPELEIEPEQT